MSFKVLWIERDARFDVEPGETVLAAAQRQGVALPHECEFGGCGTCRMRLREGSVDYDELPMALTEEEAALGIGLACQARPQSDLAISVVPPGYCSDPVRLDATVLAVSALGHDVIHLQLQLPDTQELVYQPGQYMNVLLPDGRCRSFSMASRPAQQRVDFHVRRIPGGHFTDGHIATLKPGDRLPVEIPLGSFRLHKEDERPLVMVATGTGLAPIKSMLESLMDDDDCPPVHLYRGARTPEDLYLHDDIAAWAERLYEFRYVPVLSRAGGGWSGRTGYVQDAVLADLDDLSEPAFYLCGSPAMIAGAKAAFLGRGASPEHIYCDGFVFQTR